jgi:50S ribosomal subunit-associated GTPase HflX
MDTEAVATEIVMIRQRLSEIDADVEGAGETDTDDEKKRLHDRMRQLQDQLSGSGAAGRQDSPSEPDTVQYVPPS